MHFRPFHHHPSIEDIFPDDHGWKAATCKRGQLAERRPQNLKVDGLNLSRNLQNSHFDENINFLPIKYLQITLKNDEKVLLAYVCECFLMFNKNCQ